MDVAFDTAIARYYYVARTVHIERQGQYRPGWLFYTRTRADFDEALATSTPGVKKVSAWGVASFVVRGRIQVLEMPEALAVPVWPHAVVIHLAVVLSNIFRPRRRRIRIVTYAIENLSPEAKIRGRLSMPSWLARGVVRAVGGFLMRTTDRVVFGTQAALDTYLAALPRQMRRSGLEVEVVWALPMRRPGLAARAREPRVVFLGTFETRKGIHHLIRAWPAVKEAIPGATLLLIGKAGDIEDVRAFAHAHPHEVELVEDPPRQEIFRLLDQSKVLVLFSQSTPVWKEQVGLPILEALSQGCEIVSSDETGIADWLQQSGHNVVPASASADQLASAIVSALRSSRTPAEIVANLPPEDSRKVADDVMFESF